MSLQESHGFHEQSLHTFCILNEKNDMKHILALVFASMFLGAFAQDPNITIEIEELPIEEPALTEISNVLGGTPTAYRVFAAFPDNYELLSIYGLQGEPLSISSTEALYQSPVGGPTTLDIDPFDFNYT